MSSRNLPPPDDEQDVRLRKVSRMVPTTGALGYNLKASIRNALAAFMTERKLSQSDVARAAGTSAAYLSNLLNNSWDGAPETEDQTYRDLNNWLDREARAVERDRAPVMVQTKVARRLSKAITELAESTDIVVAHAPAGVGKTFCAQVLSARVGAIYVYVHPDNCAMRPFLRDLYNAISRRKKSDRVKLQELIEKLRMPERIKSRNVVIIDQAHELDDRALRCIMALRDQADCSFLLLGTKDARDRVADDHDPLFGQFASRVGEIVDLGEGLSFDGVSPPQDGNGEFLFTAEDVVALLDDRTLKFHRDATQLLLELANYSGRSLRVMLSVADKAERAARRRGQDEVTVAYLESAMRRNGIRRAVRPAEVRETTRKAKTA